MAEIQKYFHFFFFTDKCEFNYIVKGSRSEGFTRPPLFPVTSSGGGGGPTATFPSTPEEHFRLGFHECMSETMHFLVEDEGMYPGDSLCVRILKHLGAHSENLMREHFVRKKLLLLFVMSYIFVEGFFFFLLLTFVLISPSILFSSSVN